MFNLPFSLVDSSKATRQVEVYRGSAKCSLKIINNSEVQSYIFLFISYINYNVGLEIRVQWCHLNGMMLLYVE